MCVCVCAWIGFLGRPGTVQHVVTFKIWFCWRCCYAEDIVTFKMLLYSVVVALKMLLRSRCCYVEEVVVHLRMLSKRLCGCEAKKGAFVHFAHGSCCGWWHVDVYQKKPEIPKNTQIPWEKQCPWSLSQFLIFSRYRKKWTTMNFNCLPGNPQPLPISR